MEPNEAERQRWNDERWTTVWPRRERLTDAVTAYLLDALQPSAGERVLDVGSGGGKTAIAVARLVGSEGAVVGADVSSPLSRLAGRRAAEAGVGNVTFRVVDVQTDAVAGAPFDAAVSQFGVMFFDEPVAAFRNIRAQLEPGGRLAFACWQEIERNPWFPAAALAGFLPPPPVPEPGKSPTGPFALAEPSRTSAILSDAGFVDISREALTIEVDAPASSIVDEDQLVFMGIPENRLAAAQAAVEEHMRQFELGANLSRFPLAFQLFQGRNR